MDQYLLIPFLGEWTSIYQLFWCSPGVQGFDTLPYDLAHWKSRLYLTLTRAHNCKLPSSLFKFCRGFLPSCSLKRWFFVRGELPRAGTLVQLALSSRDSHWPQHCSPPCSHVSRVMPCHAVSAALGQDLAILRLLRLFKWEDWEVNWWSCQRWQEQRNLIYLMPKSNSRSNIASWRWLAYSFFSPFTSTTVLWPWLLPLWHSGTLRWSLGMITRENFTSSLQIRSAWHSWEKKQWKSKRWSVSRRGWNVSRKSTRWKCTKTSATRRWRSREPGASGTRDGHGKAEITAKWPKFSSAVRVLVFSHVISIFSQFNMLVPGALGAILAVILGTER